MNKPLVSAIMPTANRPQLIPEAIELFLNQDYENAELVIIDDGITPVSHLIPENSKIKYYYYAQIGMIGTIRNIACSLSSGEIIIHWDDDDWYAPDWISKQVNALQNSGADVSGLNRLDFYSPNLDRSETFIDFETEYPWVYGATFAYWKSFWEKHPFDHMQTGEDNYFLSKSKAKIHINSYQAGYQGIIHEHNLSMKFTENPKYKLQLAKWIQEIKAPITASTNRIMDFKGNTPLVSCIMPTANRPDFIPGAIKYFLSQDYPNRELVILDNGDQEIIHLIPDDPRILFFKHQSKSALGVKRNWAIEHANGELICHWDDDDWYANDWLSHQVHSLLRSDADLCGINQVQFFSPSQNKYWMTRNMNSKKPWLTGASLIYRKSFWKKHPFKDIQIGEDDDFIRNNGAKVFAHDYFQGFIAQLHTNNTSIKFFETPEEKANN